MNDEIERKVEKLFTQAQPVKANVPTKTNKPRPTFFFLLFFATLVLLFQSVTVTSKPNICTTNTIYYKVAPTGQALQPVEYPFDELNFVGCAHFKRKPVKLNSKRLKII